MKARTDIKINLSKLSTIMRNRLIRQYEQGFINEITYGKRHSLTNVLNSHFKLSDMSIIGDTFGHFSRGNEVFHKWLKLQALLTSVTLSDTHYYYPISYKLCDSLSIKEAKEISALIINKAKECQMLLHKEEAQKAISAIQKGKILRISIDLNS